MIYINIYPADFEYDVMSLIQAFYPGEDFKVNKKTDENSSDDRAVSFGKTGGCSRVLNIRLENYVRQKDSKEDVHTSGDAGNKSILIDFFDGQNNFCDRAECDYSDRRTTKNILKKSLYIILTQATGRQLPWGNLTGIRPAKIPALMLEQGIEESKIRRIMCDTYLISEDKLALSMQIARRETEILRNIPYKKGYSIYVGIPFCPTTCLYCSFTSYPLERYKGLTDKYVEALVHEIEAVAPMMKDRPLNTVYVGGGTPTTLTSLQLDTVISAIKNNFDTSGVVEFTVEAGRPDSITEEKLIALKENGVDRISINPQTMNDDTLALIGRKHSVEEVRQKFAMARNAGFDNINMDIIMGLPKEDEDKVRHTLLEIRKLSPDSLTVHSLAVKRAARLNIQREKYADIKMVNNEKLMKLAEYVSKEMGMHPYYLYRQKNMSGNLENVGYARQGCEGIYNILMMGDRQDVIALGAGATTKLMSDDRISATRIDNVKNVELYIERIDEMIERKRAVMYPETQISGK